MAVKSNFEFGLFSVDDDATKDGVAIMSGAGLIKIELDGTAIQFHGSLLGLRVRI
jgi:hypothetical protein